MTPNTLPEVINKIDAAAYNVTILELIALWRLIKKSFLWEVINGRTRKPFR